MTVDELKKALSKCNGDEEVLFVDDKDDIFDEDDYNTSEIDKVIKYRNMQEDNEDKIYIVLE